MKRAAILLMFVLPLFVDAQQTPLPFSVEIEEVTFSQAPALQAYAFGEYNGRWIFMGGRISGLHGHNPFNSFPPDSANTYIWMLDLGTQQVWSYPVSNLSPSISKQLNGTNPCFTQKDSLLYYLGGYGYDNVSAQYDTWPYLLIVNLATLHDALVQGSGVGNAFTQVQDNRFAVCGGHLSYDDSLFYLVGGQKFTGRYNPHGNPSYTQVYTNAVRMFTLAGNYNVNYYQEITDNMELHRRDYNMADQVFPDGSFGFTAFSGVFRHNVDLPWFNIVDIHDQAYYPVPESDFMQLYNQYHGARVPLYDGSINEMHTLFFGGIGMYTWDSLIQQAVVDSAVPFVKTISMVTRYADSTLEERVFPVSMPGYLGASAEFIRAENVPLVEGEVIDLSALPTGLTTIGYVYGGIQSSQPNIFMQATGSSHASNRILKINLIRPATDILENESLHRMQVFPNPSSDRITAYIPWIVQQPAIYLQDMSGRKITLNYQLKDNELMLNIEHLQAGIYFLRVIEDKQEAVARIVKR